jgi:seryl-tRNA synthetase
MAREEILKQIAFISKEIRKPAFSPDGVALTFEAPDDLAGELGPKVETLAATIQRGLRNLQRKVVYRSRAAESAKFRRMGEVPGSHQMGPGQVILEGIALSLYRYFDRVFEEMGRSFGARPLLTPILIPSPVLAKCDYFRSFPNTVTFACHLPEDVATISGFRQRHQDETDLDDETLRDLTRPEACLSPAVCYHVYHLFEGQSVPAEGLVFGICGKCFRYESTNMFGLRRLWDFTMREVVFLGTRQGVLTGRDASIELVSRFLEDHELAGEVRTASDPFFVAPDAVAKTYFQLTSETKYEISLMLSDGDRLAVGSHNYHTEFFGKAFNADVEGAGPMHSVCVAFGLERWVYAFLDQHGPDPDYWPSVVRHAPETTMGAS